ncbi:uncharacterized protein [Amphiura filiformis]|uniref:uncharacterized protein n=1 Tax=Amphiura filiformis TaxID=82378 RepID=UPI003B217CE3
MIKALRQKISGLEILSNENKLEGIANANIMNFNDKSRQNGNQVENSVKHKGLVLKVRGSSSCQGRCGNHPQPYHCGCDPECETFKTAVFDYFDICPQNNITGNRNITLFTCTPLQDPRFAVMLINKCPSNWGNDFIRSICEAQVPARHQQIIQTWPVFDEYGDNYQNIFCAICNSLSITTVQPWNISYRLSLDEQYTSNKECAISGQGSKYFGKRLRFCVLQAFQSCPDTYVNQSIAETCQSYTDYICSGGGKYYKNIQCALCNGVKVNTDSSINLCILSHRDHEAILHSIWNFNDEVLAATQRNAVSCEGKDFVFDPYTGHCRTLSCSPGFQLNRNSDCVLPSNIDNRIDTICCQRQESWIISETDYYAYESTANPEYDAAVKETCLLNILNISYDDNNDASWSKNNLNSWFTSKILIQIVDTKCNMVGKLDEIMLNSGNALALCGYQHLNYLFVGMNFPGHYDTCDGEWFEGKSADFISVNITHLAEVLLFNEEYILVKTIIHQVLYADKWQSGSFTKEETVLVCGDRVFPIQLTCPVITLTSDEYYINTTENSSRVAIFRNSFFKEHEYFIYPDGRLQICADKLSPFLANLFVYNGYMAIVNIAGNVFSCCGLTAIYGVHCVYCKLRNFHGRAIMNLSVALFFAQLIPILSSQLRTTGLLCVLAAVLSHFMWLSAFIWMSIIAVNLFDTFVYNQLLTLQARQEKESSFIYRYLIPFSGWGTALIIVIICTFLHIYGSQDSFNYATTSPCWIPRSRDNLLAFGVPVGIALSLNLTLFVITVISLYQMRSQQLQLQRNVKEMIPQNVKICLKMSLLMGISWIWGFLASFFNKEPLWWIFVITNSCQGLFMAFSILSSSNIQDLINKKKTNTKPLPLEMQPRNRTSKSQTGNDKMSTIKIA